MSMREVMVVVQKGDHSLGYYDFETGRELGRVAVDPFPHEFTLSADKRTAYLAGFGVALAEHPGDGGSTVSIVDVAGRRRIGTVHCGDYRRPHDVALDGRGTLYVLCEGSSRLLVVRDPASGRFDLALPTLGHGSHMVTVLRDGSVAFSSNMESGTVTALFPDAPDRPGVVLPVGKHAEGSVLDAEERLLYVVNRESAEITIIDVQQLRVLRSVLTPPGPVRVCRDDARLLVALYHGCGLLMVDLNDPAKQQVVPLPAKAISVGYHAPSRTALLSCHDQRVYLVDTVAGAVIRSISTRSDPDPMAVVSLDM
jgi:DNA-binding beta-propeller fold protein YncE